MPEENEILPVEIHLPGLLKLLGESLYSTPRVALRELVQNAHDSCVRRREEDPAAANGYAPAIRVWADREARQLMIEDNGSGLTREEITVFLATVGRGYTSELRSRLGAGGRDEALELIGYFGLGLLSAFMIAQRVQITTASYQTPGESWRWISEGGQSYALRRAMREGVGTTVQLDLRDDALFLLDADALTDALRAYAELLSVPITIGMGGEIINAHPAPWMEEAQDEPAHARAVRYAAWVRERLDANALAVLPLDDARAPDGAVIPLRGALYVPERSVISIREYGDVAVYVRRMLITERERDLLPDWARFVTGVIECPLLNPTASRETLRHDEVYDAVRASVAAQLLAFFERLAADAPLDWAAIVRAHNDLIKGWAVRSYELFARVADLVTFKTSRGELTIPDYLRENPGRIFYYDEEDGLAQALTLFEARRLAVIDARWFADVAFLRRYSELYGTQIEQLAPGAAFIFTPFADTDGSWRPVLDACAAEGLPARLVTFQPTSLPAIMVYPPGAERLRRARQVAERPSVASPIRRLVRDYIAQQPQGDAPEGMLHLNALNPLLRRARDYGPRRPEFAPLMSILIANARVFAGQGLSAQETIACFDRINAALAELTGLEGSGEADPRMLSAPALTDLGLRQDVAARLCARCPTVDDLLAADLGALAEELGVSPLLLATVREELSRQAPPATQATTEPRGVIAPIEMRRRARGAERADGDGAETD
ncbi:MAG TPA: ATP-binding protein [Ktedonobacterales bacterium]|nr:ATP-binding protein [Ktedonobacterales bacterium]